MSDREQQLEACLRDLMGLIEKRELVRNTQADHQHDWYSRMLTFVMILKRAEQILKPIGERE